MRTLSLFLALVATTTLAPTQSLAQSAPTAPAKTAAPAPSANPLMDFTRLNYTGGKLAVLTTAEKVPEQLYNFRPTESVRTIGQLLGHIADAQYTFCSVARGEKNPALYIEKSKTTKADLIAALNLAFAYCDKAFDSMTDASGMDPVKIMGIYVPRIGTLIANNQHISLHYGNLVTYMRINNILPPSSDPEVMQRMMKR